MNTREVSKYQGSKFGLIEHEHQLAIPFSADQLVMHELASTIRILVGCEESGTVRDAFLSRGYDAYSCDILPDRRLSNRHFQCDVREVLDDDWDMIVLTHPPCTALCNSGVRWLKSPPPGKTKAEMQQRLVEGAELFSDCWNAPSPRIACENPIMHRFAKQLIRNFKSANYVQPWWFGEPAFKATGFHLRNLPPLVPTNKLTPPLKGTAEHKAWSAIHRAPPGPERAKFRSKTFQGIADAIADQWGEVLLAARLAEGA